MRLTIILALATMTFAPLPVTAQSVGPNINVLPLVLPVDADNDDVPDDPDWFLKGDGFLQRQVEPSIAVSTRNPDHVITFFNDYRAVNLATDEGPPDPFPVVLLALNLNPPTTMLARFLADVLPLLQPPTASSEAWVGMSRSYDGGLTWLGGMLPGGPEDGSPASLVSPIKTADYQAATDPVAGAAPCGYVYVVFVAFTRGDESSLAVARYQDLNNDESGDTWVYDRTWVLETGNNATNGYFLDKPFLAVDHDRSGAGGCGHSVFVSYTTFNGLDKDGKFQSKVNVARTLDMGASWDKIKINKTYGQGQGTAIAIDPRPGTPTTTGGGTVWVAFRHFFNPNAILVTKSTDYGTKWSAPVEITAGTPMATFDQPTFATTAVPDPITDINFRTNAFPTLAVTGTGTVFAGWQERVDIASDPGSFNFGRPDPAGSPRIVVMKKTPGSATWTDVDGFTGTRRAIDFGYRDGEEIGGECVPFASTPAPGFGALPQCRPSGPQMKPRLVFGGGRLLLGYTESRGLLTTDLATGDEILEVPFDLSPTGFASGYYRAFDFRAALLDPATGQLDSTTQVSRYPMSASAVLSDGEQVAEVAPINPPCSPDFDYLASALPPCVRQLNLGNRPQSGAGTSPFMGDYPDATSMLPFVPDGIGWRWATEPGDVPFRGFRVVFPDNRHLVPPTEPEFGYDEIDRYPFYGAPGTGAGSCVNPGSRNTDVLTARVDAELVLSTPTSYKQLDARRSFPFSVGNRTDTVRFYRLTITDGAEYATFSPKTDPVVDRDSGDLEIFPFSSVAHVIYVDPGWNEPVRVEVEEIVALGGDPVAGGQRGTVVFNADPDNPWLNIQYESEEQNPFVENPFVENPFVENPFVENPFVENPFVENPFVENPFVENSTPGEPDYYDIIDTTWTVSAAGSNTAASYFALLNIDNAAQFVGNYAFQLIVYKNADYGTADGCEAIAQPEPQVLSNVVQNPFVENPFVENPFVENPFVENPFVDNPFVENSTFALAPSDAVLKAAQKVGTGDDGTLKAPRGPDQVKVRLRAYQLVPDTAIAATGGFFYNPDPLEGGDSPALTVIARGCDTTDPAATCYFSSAPDLVATGVDQTPLEVAAGTEGYAFPAGGWTLLNKGTTPANAEIRELRHGVYLSIDETVVLDESDLPQDGDVLVGVQDSAETTIAVGGFEEFSTGVSLTIPTDVPPGDYYLVLFVDDYREVSESDERNTWAVPVAITNPPPVAQDLSFTMDEDTVLANGELDPDGVIRENVSLVATDPNGESLTYSITTLPAHGLLTLVDTATGEFSYVPENHFYGADSFEYVANDGTSDSNLATVTIDVRPVNDTPSIGDNNFTVTENTTLEAALEAFDVEDPDALTFTGITGPDHGTLSLNPDGTFTYTPDQDFLGIDSFDFLVADTGGASATGTATITVYDPVPDWLFIGFDNPWRPGYTVNAGSSIPLKWRYADPATGAVVNSSTSNLELRIKGWPGADCHSNGSTIYVVEDAGSSDLRYVDGDWQINWDTAGLPSGCYAIAVYHPTTNQLDTENSLGQPLTVKLR